MSNKEDLIRQITANVWAKRTERGTIPTPGRKQEPSGIAFGEDNVLAISLLTTTEGTGAWKELPGLDDDFLEEVAAAVERQ